MIRFTIPKEDRKAFIDLFLSEPERRDAFLEIIKDPAKVPHAGDFAEHLKSTIKVDHQKADKIIEVLFKIYNLYDTSGEEIDAIASALIDAFKEFDKKEIKEPSEKDLKSFSEFFGKVLSLHDTLGVRAKAYRLMPQHQYIFLRSELYSDIRPVFRPDNPDIRPSAAIIVHSLKIIYREGDETKEFYLGLDDNDLHQLMNTIDRAIKKHECLKTMIMDLGIQCLEEEEN